ncbi:hypothetical protein THRCLA_10419 [Thraustotheca clavata]|uniref:Uncharacterized protein n=1 Tax=Thraustotheca clavata TaxID=74557 RepID=A0A1V9YQQ3_9STRA|nr:hypothetical protein THRCLA_10419 [Thraustotheca clavata]
MEALIQAFSLGALPTLAFGTQLRGYLATELQCTPMRISKKLGGGWLLDKPIERSLGRKMYCRDYNMSFVKEQAMLLELNQLRSKFLVNCKPTRSPPKSARGGNWSLHEQSYAFKLIEFFLKGVIQAPRGITLRAYLSQQLRCCPMRISKKLGSSVLFGCTLPRHIGRTPFAMSQLPIQEVHKLTQEAEVELYQLRRLCFKC